MDSVRWSRIQSLFHDVADRQRAEQRTLLARACPDDPTLVDEVLALLEEDANGESLLDEGIGKTAEYVFQSPTVSTVDAAQFLPYRLVAPLGEGGMGVVFLAEREDVGMQVAIKLLRDAWLSPARRQRFTEEQRTLAQFSHPGIARLYDARTLRDGTPWFVMEYVDGVPLTEYCTTHQCPIEQRLRLFLEVCEAVRYAHERGVIHRDLKPSNILVKRDRSVRLLDFGIAKQLDPATGGARTTIPIMTPAYAAPEQLRGQGPSVTSDIYSLGVVLYELLAGRLPVTWPDASTAGAVPQRMVTKPSAAARASAEAWRARPPAENPSAWRDLDDVCLTAMHEDPPRRYQSVEALIRDLEHLLRHEPVEARPDPLPYTIRRWMRRRWRGVVTGAGLLMAGGVVVAAATMPSNRAGAADESAVGRTVAVMPLRNAAADSSLDFLRLSVADEIAATLGLRRGVTVRPFSSTSRFDADTLDVRRAGRSIGVATVVSGTYERQGPNVRITLVATDVATGRVLWEDRLTVDPTNLITLQTNIAARAGGGLAAALGAAAAPVREVTRPRNEGAYELYLRSAGGRLDPGEWNTKAIAMLERAVALDSAYAPAWLALARRYYVEARFQTGDMRFMDKAQHATEQAIRLDPDYAVAGSRLMVLLVERGQVGDAYRKTRDMLRRRPDNPDVHFVLSYVLRFAGLLEESARECSVAISNDPYNLGWRSCAVPAMLLGNEEGAKGFLGLDPGSEWSKAMSIHMLIRSGKQREALAVGAPQIPQWKSYELLLACAAGRPPSTIDSLAVLVRPDDDPEANFFAASHLAYCGKTGAALDLLTRAIRGHYCSYPVMETDPYFARLREVPEFAKARAAGAACRAAFLAEVGRP